MDKKLFNLTTPQEAIWAQEMYYSNTSINNAPGNLHIDEPVDFDVLKKAINIVIKNHDGMRLKITLDGEPKQYVEDFISKDFEILEFENKEQLKEWSVSKAQTSFGNILDKELFDFTLFKLKHPNGQWTRRIELQGASYYY